ncbi:cobalt-precorrin-6A reductase [Actibacterium sp. D379-3]
MPRILVLGGTTEASALARALAKAGADAVFSYAGRTHAPMPQPLPTRVGGFGGVAGLVRFLRENAITHVVDATHPFAAQMSTHAVVACAQTGVALCALERAPWQAGSGDRWTSVPDIPAAARALPRHPARVFLSIGRQHLAAFSERPEHFYLLRLVDPPETPVPLPRNTVVIARGPFTAHEDRALMARHGIEAIVAKNAGGSGARAKLGAARMLGLPVILIDRPPVPARMVFSQVAGVLGWLGHSTDLGV